MVYKFFDKKTPDIGDVKCEIMSNESPFDLIQVAKVSDCKRELAEELHKPIIRKFERWKVHPSFIDNIWGAYLADMQLISKYNKVFQFLLGVIDIYN